MQGIPSEHTVGKDGSRSSAWLEIISVRAAGSGEIGHALELCRRVVSEHSRDSSADMVFYRSARHATDLSIHIHRHAAPGKPANSIFGLQMAQALSEFGIINHTLWLLEKQNIGEDSV